MVTGRSFYNRIGYCLGRILSILPNRMLMALFSIVDPFGGYTFSLIRVSLLKAAAVNVGDSVYIGKRVTIKGVGKLFVGDNVSIHQDCYLDCSGGLQILSDVSIAHDCSIITFEHNWADASLPIRRNPLTYMETVVGPDVWMGCGARVLAGARVGPRVVVAAGAVVPRSVAPLRGVLVGGVPARVIRAIGDDGHSPRGELAHDAGGLARATGHAAAPMSTDSGS